MVNSFKHNNCVFNEIANLDEKFGKFAYNINLKPIEEIIYLFAYAFNPIPIVTYCVILLNLYPSILVSKIIITTVSGVLLTLFLKKATFRIRPKDLLNRKYNFRVHEKNYSMPSGDSFQSSLWATVFSIYLNNNFGFIFVPFVMFARCYYHCHFLSDTIVGAALGYIHAKFIYLILSYLY